MSEQARLRLRSVRFKDGRQLRILKRADHRADFRKLCDDVLMNQGEDCVGIAIVAWGADNASTAEIRTAVGNRIPQIVVPDFIRNRLLALKIENWTVESIKDK